MTEDDEMGRRAACGRKAGTGERTWHRMLAFDGDDKFRR
jgi:hypothetical protein